MLAIAEYETLDAKTGKHIDALHKVLVDTESRGLPDKVNKMIEALKPNETGEITIEKPYGDRQSELVRVVPSKTFRENKISPVAGMVVSLDGVKAVVKSSTGARVIVDLNHPLAGKTITYHAKVLETAKETLDKAKLFMKYYNVPGTVTNDNNKLIITPSASDGKPVPEETLKKVKALANVMKMLLKTEVQVSGA